jgi:hypothetical protein
MQKQVYRCYKGILLTYEVVQENAAVDARGNLDTLRELFGKGTTFNAHQDRYHATPQAAYERYRKKCLALLPEAEEAMRNAIDYYAYIKAEIVRMQEKIARP